MIVPSRDPAQTDAPEPHVCPQCGLHPFDFTVDEYKRELDRAEARVAELEDSLRGVTTYRQSEAVTDEADLASRASGSVGGLSTADPASLPQWRTGRKVGRTLYAQIGEQPADTDPLIGVMDTPELARAVVEAHNVGGAA